MNFDCFCSKIVFTFQCMASEKVISTIIAHIRHCLTNEAYKINVVVFHLYGKNNSLNSFEHAYYSTQTGTMTHSIASSQCLEVLPYVAI